jgi:hypothetical protein
LLPLLPGLLLAAYRNAHNQAMAVGSGRYFLRSGSGSFAIFAAIRLASSRVSSLAAVRRPGSVSK